MKLLVVEDDARLRRLLCFLLSAEGYQMATASNSADALTTMAHQEVDLVLVRVREASNVPVIVVSSCGRERERIEGLSLGADDYVVKPFPPGELSARIAAVLRRAESANGKAPERRLEQGVIEHGDLWIDSRSREVRRHGQIVDLTAKEFDLLAFLAGSPRQVFTRHQLLEHVWSSSGAWQVDATVTEHVRRLRRKLEVDPNRPMWIRTVRGVGYRFEPVRGRSERRSPHRPGRRERNLLPGVDLEGAAAPPADVAADDRVML